MKLQKYIFFFLCFAVFQSYGQNRKFLFGNSDIPQSLLLNPGAEVHYEKHIGIPFLSGLYFNVGSNNLTVKDLFSNDGIDINDKLRNQIFELKSTDFITINEQLDIINIGYRLQNNRDYLSFGFYQELDFIGYYPKDLAILFYQGNTDENGDILLNTNTNINQLSFKGQSFGVFHVGISRKINNRLNIGARAKLYSGVFNAQSLNNSGNFTSTLGTDNIYRHELQNLDYKFQSSGLLKDNKFNLSPNNFVKNFFSGGNLGLGLDLGVTYNLSEKIKISASALDIGFISYSRDVTTYTNKGDYTLEGIGLLFPEDDPIPYWERLIVDFDEQIKRENNNKTYISWASVKLNAGLTYGFGKQIRRLSTEIDCHANNGFSLYDYQNEVGFQFYSIFRPLLPQIATTVFFKRRISNFLQAKVTYTLDNYSFANLGLGFSARVNKFNFYASADNLLGYADLYNSKKISLSLGANLIFD